MDNNDVLRRIRYVFDFDDKKMMAIFGLADLSVERGQVIAWLRKEEDPVFEALDDRILATFLNGLISEKRGKRDGPQPEPETSLNNNIVLMKLKIAVDMKSEDVIATIEQAGFSLSAAELGSFMRRPGHRNYRECKDQVLRNFLKGLQIKLRGDSTTSAASNSAETDETADKSSKATSKSPYGKWSE
jgi:uncharacterized protein YehS (DUF1456 family)